MIACHWLSRVASARDPRRWFVLSLLFSVPLACPVRGQLLQRPVALQGARILTMDGGDLEAGTLVIQGETIRTVARDPKLPVFTKKVPLADATITPGLIDVSSVLGRVGPRVRGGGGATRRAEDSFDRYDTANLREVLSHGVTAVYLSPVGPAGICGTGAVIRLTGRANQDAVGQVLQSEAALCIDLDSDSQAVSRLKTLQSVRKAITAAQQYRRTLEDYEEDLEEYLEQLEKQAAMNKAEDSKKSAATASDDEPEKKPEAKQPSDADNTADPKKPRRPTRDAAHELILRALDAEMPVRVIAHRSSDILNALELADEFSLRLILEGASEAHLVADQIAESEVQVVLGPVDLPAWRRAGPERRHSDQVSMLLERAGVTWFVGSGATSAARSRFVLPHAQLATQFAGAPDPLVLATARAADLLRVAQIGRLRPGAYADFVVWSGDPRDPGAKVLRVYVGGRQVYGPVE